MSEEIEKDLINFTLDELILRAKFLEGTIPKIVVDALKKDYNSEQLKKDYLVGYVGDLEYLFIKYKSLRRVKE